jgi:hypothetical protein
MLLLIRIPRLAQTPLVPIIPLISTSKSRRRFRRRRKLLTSIGIGIIIVIYIASPIVIGGLLGVVSGGGLCECRGAAPATTRAEEGQGYEDEG